MVTLRPTDTRSRRLHAVSETADAPTGIDLSFQREHLRTAAYFVALARRLESRGAAVVGPEGMVRHRACVTGAIFSSVAFLEASINELYVEFKDAGHTNGNSHPNLAHVQLEKLWPTVEAAPLAHRYQVALEAVDAERFSERQPAYRNVQRLLELRDALVHHQPERHDERRRHQSLQRRLRHRFAPNTLLAARARWFPDLCLGSGCATWALRSVEAFSDEFCGRMGIASRLRPAQVPRRVPLPRDLVIPI